MGMNQNKDDKKQKISNLRYADKAIKSFSNSNLTCTAASLLCFWNNLRNALEVSNN